MKSKQHPALYISESPGEINHQQMTCWSVIYQGCALSAHRPDHEATMQVARKAADQTNLPVFVFYGQSGQFSDKPVYTPKR